MEGLKRRKGTYLVVGIIVTFGLLMSGNIAIAQDELNWFNATLLTGQGTGSQGFSAEGAVGNSIITVTSIGNRTATSSLSVTSGQSGIWTIFLIGTGGRTFADFVVGVSPFSGPNAGIDIGSGVSFVWAFGTVFAVGPEVGVDPIKWNLSVSGQG